MWLIDVAMPGDSRIQQKEVEKITKYQDIKIEVERLWEKKATVYSTGDDRSPGSYPKRPREIFENPGT